MSLTRRLGASLLAMALVTTIVLGLTPAGASPGAASAQAAEQDNRPKDRPKAEAAPKQPTATKAPATPTRRPATATPKPSATPTKDAKPTSTPTTGSGDGKATPTATPKRTPTLEQHGGRSTSDNENGNDNSDDDSSDDDNDNRDGDDNDNRRARVAAPTPTASPTPTAEPPTPTATPEESEPLSLATAEPTPILTPEPTVEAAEPASPALAATVYSPTLAIGSYDYPSWSGACGRALQYWELLEAAAKVGGADPHLVAALLAVEGSGERAVSPAGAMGLMQLMPDKFRPGDDPFDVQTNLLRAAQHVVLLERRYSGSGERVAAAYFGAIDAGGNVTGASDGNVDGFEYVRRFQAALGCVRSGLGLPGEQVADLVSPLGVPLTPAHVSFGFLDDYGPGLARYIRGEHGVAQHGTRHLAWDLVIPGAPANGRGYPVLSPLAGRVIRTSDPVGGPFGLWIENPALNLRARLMHLDGLAPGIVDGAQVRAGQLVGSLGAQGTEDFPHLHLGLELLSTGQRLDPARFYFRSGTRPLGAAAGGQPIDGPAREAAPVAADSRARTFSLPGLGTVGPPAAWGNTLVWPTDGPDGRVLMGYDLELGWAFRVGSPAARSTGAPAIAGQLAAWLDTRHAADSPGLVDVYAYDLTTGQERRLTPAPGRFSDLILSERAAAWVSRDQAEPAIQLRDLLTDRLVTLQGGGQPGDLAAAGPLLAWVDRAADAPSGAPGALHAYDLTTAQASVLKSSRAARPAIAGASVFWEEQVGAGPERLIRGRDLQTGREWIVTPSPSARRNLRAADAELLWEEPAADGRIELRAYGLSGGETRVLASRPAAAAFDAAAGRGAVAWREDGDRLAVAALHDWDVPGGRFFADPAGDGGWVGPRGFGLTNDGGIPYFDEYLRLGGAAALGRPIGGRTVLEDGLVYLATEHALLQWRPDLERVVVANPLELLHTLRRDAWLQAEHGVPLPVADDGSGGDPARSREARLAWLTDPRIRQLYLANPDPAAHPAWTAADAVERFGLPMSRPEQRADGSVVQRFQRAVLVRERDVEHGLPRPDTTALRVGALFREALLAGAAEPEPGQPL